MSSPNRLLIAAALLAASAQLALADALVYDPVHPGYHPGSPAYYQRYGLYPKWFERRDTMTLQAGDAVAANKAMMMRDPWPPYVGNRHIRFHGEVMDSAIDRYKTDAAKIPEVLSPTE